MAEFKTGEQTWTANLGNLRNTIRQDLIAKQLQEHIQSGAAVLDVGCGQGTQALRLLQQGHAVTGVDLSQDLLEKFAADAEALSVQPELFVGRIEDLSAALGQRTFDVVCSHGVLMYLEDRAGAVAQLAARASPGGLLSFTVKNANGLAFRPGLRRDWGATIEAFGSRSYVNEIGVAAEADFLHEVEAYVTDAGLEIERWYGVRVFNDGVPSDLAVPTNEDLDALLQAEYLAGANDPYRSLASQMHIIARRPL